MRYIALVMLLYTSPVIAAQVGDKATWNGSEWVADQKIDAGIDVIASYDYYLVPKTSGKHNYEDGQGLTLGVEHSIAGNLKGQLTYSRILDIDFPFPLDDKGSWGELRGHIPMYALKSDLPYGNKFGLYLLAGVGYGLWDFRENPYLQDRNVKVELDGSIVVKLGIGASVSLGQDWKLDLESGWLDTDIPKDISDNDYGIEHILDSGDIGLQMVPIKVGVRKRF